MDNVARRAVLGAAGAGAASLLGAPSASAATAREWTRLRLALDRYKATRSGTVGLMVYDRRDRTTFSWRAFRNETLSTVKVLILVALLRRSEQTGRALTSTQRTQAWNMIVYSDNASTDALLASLGVPYVQSVANLLGMSSTVVRGGSTGWWGYSTTVPLDLIRLINAITWGTSVINATSRAYCRDLMDSVTSSQRWGVSDPPLPGRYYTFGKNGWGPMSTGYRLNSFGRVSGYGRDYTMAVLSRSPAGFSYGRETLNRVMLIVNEAMGPPIPASVQGVGWQTSWTPLRQRATVQGAAWSAEPTP